MRLTCKGKERETSVNIKGSITTVLEIFLLHGWSPWCFQSRPGREKGLRGQVGLFQGSNLMARKLPACRAHVYAQAVNPAGSLQQ